MGPQLAEAAGLPTPIGLAELLAVELRAGTPDPSWLTPATRRAARQRASGLATANACA